MSSFTKQQFRDEILAVVYDGLKADSYTENLRIMFEDDDSDDTAGRNEPNSTESWIEIIIRHTGSDQTLSGSAGNRRYHRDGLISVNIYTPLGDNLKANDIISEIVSNIFESYSGALWFRNTSSSEIGPTRSWYMTSVISEFQYDQIR